MKHFKSFKNLKAASLEDIKAAKVIPEEVAEELVRVLAQYNERKEEKEEQLADSVLANTIRRGRPWSALPERDSHAYEGRPRSSPTESSFRQTESLCEGERSFQERRPVWPRR